MPEKYNSSKLETIQADLQQAILRKDWAIGEKLPTEAELARKYGCSVGTVNKAFSLLVHHGLIERKPRMGTRVLSHSIESGGIKLDAYAFICPSNQHEGIWRTMKGFQSMAQDKQRRMLMLTSGPDYNKEVEIIKRLPEFDVLGAVLYPVVPSFEDLVHFSQVLQSSRLPVVMVGTSLPGQGVSGVSIDGFHAGYTVTLHHLSRGLKRIGFISNRSWSVSMRDRYQGYKWALTEAGIEEDERLVMRTPSMQVDFDEPMQESMEMAKAYLDQVKGLGVEGVVCTNDFLARGVIEVAGRRGIKVPGDLKVTGIDDYSVAMEGAVKITTYRVPHEKMGQISFSLLESLLENKGNEVSDRTVRGTLVIRDSA